MLLPRLRLPQDIASPTHGLPVEDDGEGVLRREERRWSLTKRHASHHRRTDYGLWSGLPSSTSAVQKGGHMYVSGGTHTPSSSEPVPRCFCLPRYGWFVMGVSMTYPPSSGQPCHRCAFSLVATVKYTICRSAGTGLHGLQGVSRPHAPCGYGTSRELPPGLADIDTAVPPSSHAWVYRGFLTNLQDMNRGHEVSHSVLANVDQSWSLVSPLWRRALEHDIVRP